MGRMALAASTLVLGLGALICWGMADYAVTQMYQAEGSFPYAWLAIAMPAVVCFVLLFVAFVANFVDMVAPIWEAKKQRR